MRYLASSISARRSEEAINVHLDTTTAITAATPTATIRPSTAATLPRPSTATTTAAAATPASAHVEEAVVTVTALPASVAERPLIDSLASHKVCYARRGWSRARESACDDCCLTVVFVHSERLRPDRTQQQVRGCRCVGPSLSLSLSLSLSPNYCLNHCLFVLW